MRGTVKKIYSEKDSAFIDIISEWDHAYKMGDGIG